MQLTIKKNCISEYSYHMRPLNLTWQKKDGVGVMQISAAAAVSSVTHWTCPLSPTTEIVKSSTTVLGWTYATLF